MFTNRLGSPISILEKAGSTFPQIYSHGSHPKARFCRFALQAPGHESLALALGPIFSLKPGFNHRTNAAGFMSQFSVVCYCSVPTGQTAAPAIGSKRLSTAHTSNKLSDDSALNGRNLLRSCFNGSTIHFRALFSSSIQLRGPESHRQSKSAFRSRVSFSDRLECLALGSFF